MSENVYSRCYNLFKVLSPWLKELFPGSLAAACRIESWLCFACSRPSRSPPASACPRRSRQHRSPSPTQLPAPASSKPSHRSSVSSLGWSLSYMIPLALWMKMSFFSLGKLGTIRGCRCALWYSQQSKV